MLCPCFPFLSREKGLCHSTKTVETVELAQVATTCAISNNFFKKSEILFLKVENSNNCGNTTEATTLLQTIYQKNPTHVSIKPFRACVFSFSRISPFFPSPFLLENGGKKKKNSRERLY